MNCRPGCAACCIVLSISTPIPGLPDGKPPFRRCPHLDPVRLTCDIWNTAEYPEVCRKFTPKPENCGSSRDEAMAILSSLERATTPERS